MEASKIVPLAAGVPQREDDGSGDAVLLALRMPLLTKEQVARHYSFSIRWVELQLVKGMPSRMIGGRRRFDLDAVDRWLRDTYGSR